jgi:hypothetical protein
MSSIYEINFTNLSGKDDKYYKFTILSLGEVSIISKAQMYYIHYYIYDANGNQVWEKDFFEDRTTGVSSINEKIDLTTGAYYLVLQSHVSGNYQFNLAFQDAGETYTETGNGTNNFMSTANDISFGNTYKGQIAQNDEKDFYKFELNSSKKLTFQMTSSQIKKFIIMFMIKMENKYGMAITMLIMQVE